jgi:hypothetical protein
VFSSCYLRRPTSLVLLMLLALGSFLAGLNLASLELCFLGLVLALAVPAVSWVKQSMLFVILAGAFVVEPQGKSGNSHRRIGAACPATEGGCGIAERLETSQREIVGRDALIRCEKSGAPSAACAASLICERRRSSSNGSVVSIRPE